MSRPKRKIQQKKKDLAPGAPENQDQELEGLDADFAAPEQGFAGVESSDHDDFEKVTKKGKKHLTTKQKKAAALKFGLKPILPLEDFYDSSVAQTVPVEFLALPHYMQNPVFYPHTFESFDTRHPSNSCIVHSDSEPIVVDERWLLIDSISMKGLPSASDHLNHELNLNGRKIKLSLPALRANQVVHYEPITAKRSVISKAAFVMTGRRTRYYVRETLTGPSYDTTEKSILEALIDLVDTDPYFRHQFPLVADLADEAYPTTISGVVDGLTGRLKPVDARVYSSLSPTTESFFHDPAIPQKDLSMIHLPSYLYPSMLGSTSITSFRFSCSFLQDLPQILVYVDKKILTDSTNTSPHLAVVYQKYLVTSSLRSHALMNKRLFEEDKLFPATLDWMVNEIEQKLDHSKHNLSFGETSSLFQLEKGHFVDLLSNRLLEESVSAHFLETAMSVYGGIISSSVETEAEKRQLFLKLIQREPSSSFASLSMTSFQKVFLLPSLASLIVVHDEIALEAWSHSISLFNEDLEIPLVQVIVSESSTWEDLVFADIVLYVSPKGLKSEHLLFQRRTNSGDDPEYNEEPDSLIFMKEIISTFEKNLKSSDRVTVQGVYWKRVVYDMTSSELCKCPVASDWKWCLVSDGFDVNDDGYSKKRDVVTTALISKHVTLMEYLAIRNRFLLSLSPVTMMRPPAPLLVIPQLDQPLQAPALDIPQNSPNLGVASPPAFQGVFPDSSEIINLSDSDVEIAPIASSSRAVSEFDEQIASLYDMGFTDTESCSHALIRFNGNIQDALNFLVEE